MCICVQKRETKIEQITNDTLDQIDDNMLRVENHPILYIVDKDGVSKFLSEIGRVSAKPNAPDLTVSNVTHSGAAISLSSDYENASVLYSVFYRKMVQTDDEKEHDWEEKALDRDSNSIIIDSLQPASNFETFTTSKFPFEWDEERKHWQLSLSNNGKTFTMTGPNGWRSVYAKQKISRKTMKQCRFEITMRYFETSNLFFIATFNTSSYNECCTERRFVDAKHVQSTTTGTHIGGQQNHCAFRIHDNYNGYCYNKIGGQQRHIGDNSLQWKENDRLELRFELKSGVCSVFLNSKKLGNLANQFPDEFYLGASANYAKPKHLQKAKNKMLEGDRRPTLSDH